jgi:hypothetical protein
MIGKIYTGVLLLKICIDAPAKINVPNKQVINEINNEGICVIKI